MYRERSLSFPPAWFQGQSLWVRLTLMSMSAGFAGLAWLHITQQDPLTRKTHLDAKALHAWLQLRMDVSGLYEPTFTEVISAADIRIDRPAELEIEMEPTCLIVDWPGPSTRATYYLIGQRVFAMFWSWSGAGTFIIEEYHDPDRLIRRLHGSDSLKLGQVQWVEEISPPDPEDIPFMQGLGN